MSLAPPIAPASDDQQTVYLVLDNFGGRMGRSWRETDEARTDQAAVIVDLMDGQYHDPIRVVAFNTSDGWSRDASRELANLIVQDCERDGFDIPPFLRTFVEQHRSSRSVQRSSPPQQPG
jgi:hypothetical protein